MRVLKFKFIYFDLTFTERYISIILDKNVFVADKNKAKNNNFSCDINF